MPLPSRTSATGPQPWIGAAVLALAIMIPVGISLLFPEPAVQPAIPIALSTIVVMLLAALRHRVAAVIAAIAGVVATWYLNAPPGHSFHLHRAADGVAIVTIAVVGLVSALLLVRMMDRVNEMRITDASRQVAIATDRMTLNAIQQAILPRAPLSVDGVHITTAYRMAGPSAGTLGGDFYVLVPFENGSIGIGIGDVAGHGADAVASMASARMTLRSVATITPDPSLAMQRTELVLRRSGALDFLTLLYGVLDPIRGTWTWVNAGHPPPVLRRADGTTELLDAPSSGVLCLRPTPATFSPNQCSIASGDALVLYTDGMVETRHRSIDEGIEQLRSLVSEELDDDDRFANRIMESVGGEPADDVALLVARVSTPKPRTPAPSPPFRFYRRRPSRVRARPAREGELIETPLGTWTATGSDFVVDTADGEQLVPEITFHRLFEEDREPPVQVARQHFEGTRADAHAARTFVAQHLDGVEVDSEAARLLTSELVTNALMHARTGFDVALTTDRDSVEISVTDGSPDDIQVAAPVIDAVHGRGLALVENLADDWGTTREGDSKTVWFRLKRVRT